MNEGYRFGWAVILGAVPIVIAALLWSRHEATSMSSRAGVVVRLRGPTYAPVAVTADVNRSCK